MPDLILAPFVFLIGAVVGSFINVVSLRYPKQPFTGRSNCPGCSKEIAPHELFPLLSFTFLRGKCSNCKKELSAQYPVVELFMGIAALIIFIPFPTSYSQILLLSTVAAIVGVLVILFLIDLRTFLLPDVFVFLLTIISLIFIWLKDTGVLAAAYGALIGLGFLGFLWLVTKGRGIGLGDVKLMIPLGLIFGFTGTIILLGLSFIAGGALSALLLLTKRVTLKTAIPFGPFLTGTAILFIIYPQLLEFLSKTVFNIYLIY